MGEREGIVGIRVSAKFIKKLILGSTPHLLNSCFQGVLRNTEPLNYTQAKSYILTIVAHDCGMRQSKSTLVTVNVREACVDGVQGVLERVSYTPGVGARKLAPDAHIVTCAASNACTVKSVESIVTLKSDHIAQGCDRDDVFSAKTQTR